MICGRKQIQFTLFLSCCSSFQWIHSHYHNTHVLALKMHIHKLIFHIHIEYENGNSKTGMNKNFFHSWKIPKFFQSHCHNRCWKFSNSDIFLRDTARLFLYINEIPLHILKNFRWKSYNAPQFTTIRYENTCNFN